MRYTVIVGILVAGLSTMFWLTRAELLPKTPVDPTTPASTTETVVAPKDIPLIEKVGRLFIVGHWTDTPLSETTDVLTTHQLGGVIVMSAPENLERIRTWTNEWQSTTSYPLLIAIDQEGGTVSRLRGDSYIQTAQPEITTATQAHTVGFIRGKELALLGINTNFAPVVEASVNPNGFLYKRVFRNAADIPTLAAAMLEGFREQNVLGVIKHYPGHEDEPTDSHLELPIVELTGTTFAEHTRPFRELIERDQVQTLMTAHVLVPDIDPDFPATLSSKILQGELRENLGYEGLIITDDMSMDAIDARYSTPEASVLALRAEADMILLAAEPALIDDAIAAVIAAVEAGELSEDTIDQSVRRIETALKGL